MDTTSTISELLGQAIFPDPKMMKDCKAYSFKTTEITAPAILRQEVLPHGHDLLACQGEDVDLAHAGTAVFWLHLLQILKKTLKGETVYSC